MRSYTQALECESYHTTREEDDNYYHLSFKNALHRCN
ncbi:MAG: hypothetical protein ACI80S_002124 [Pseudohongiellaceae bacterium]|jgi:hypothetical protein